MNYRISKHWEKGFTLLEILLVVALISMIAGLSAPIVISVKTRNDLDVATVGFVQTLRRAQVLARSVEADTAYGVSINTGEIVLFRGGAYVTRDVAYDELTKVPLGIEITGLSEVVFSKLGGLPVQTGEIVFATSSPNERKVAINSLGMIEY